jgi:hypothetical protein
VRYFLCTLIGVSLIVASCVAIAYAVYQLLQIGTCATGGPYQVARECPGGTERMGLAIPVALITMLIGAVFYAARGRAPGSDRDPRPGLGIALIWAGIFLGIAFACFWGVWGPDANPGPGGKLGGQIVGFLFVPMGIGGALMFLKLGSSMGGGMSAVGIGGAGDVYKLTRAAASGDFSKLPEGMLGRVVTPTQPATGGGGGVVAELERLNRLRREGAINEQEFERLKKSALEKI